MHSTRSARTRIAVVSAAAASTLAIGLVPGIASAATSANSATAATPAAPVTASRHPLAPGTAPTSVPARVPRRYVGTAFGVDIQPVTVTVTKSGRYTIEYRSSQFPAGLNTVVDGTFLQQTGIGAQSTAYSQTFFLDAGTHTIGLGGPAVYSPVKAYLVGRL